MNRRFRGSDPFAHEDLLHQLTGIEWSDVIRQWSRQPSIGEVRKIKARLPGAPHAS